MSEYKLIYNDSSHGYWLNGRRVKSVTAVAKIVADSFALDQWRKRQVAIGMMLEPRLAERVAVDPDNRETVDRVCEEALQMAGAHHAANRGTQRHRASELIDTGGTLFTEQQRADAEAWQRTISHHGITILPEFVECFVCWPEFGVVGRFDRIGLYRGKPVIIDLKSGQNAVKYPQSTAAQLALYARAPLISANATTVGDKTTITEWRSAPEGLDLRTGYVVLLTDEMETGELWRIDIEHGWSGALNALALVDWRKAYDYGAAIAQPVKPYTEPEATALLMEEMDAVVITLEEQIVTAPTVAALEALWSANRDGWTDGHTEAARVRKAELGRRHQPIRDFVASATGK